MPGRGIWRLRTWAVLASTIAGFASASCPTPALAQTQDIASAGPLTHIYLSDALQCQVDYAGDAAHEFFGDVPGSCGTFLRTETGQASLTPISQSGVTGSGTAADPFRVVTQVSAQDSSSAPTGLELIRTDSYVVGQDFYRSDVTVSNSNGAGVSAVLWHGADCYLQEADQGYGLYDASTGGIYCTKNPRNSPPARIEGFVPLGGDSRYYEGSFSTALSDPGPTGFPSTCACDELLDNGMGLSWNIDVPASGSTTRSFLTTFSPQGQTFGGPQAPQAPKPVQLSDLPPPVLGKTANVAPTKGQVSVRLGPKGQRFIPLREARQVPVGSLLNTRRGTVRIATARNAAAKLQSGRFLGGVFQVLQSRKARFRGLTELRLKGSSFSRCGGRSSRIQALGSAGRTIRRLSGSARGRFRTRGRRSAATVRGTKWTVTDRCDGTLTKVARGKVAVRDFRLRKTILLTSGKSYLARAPR